MTVLGPLAFKTLVLRGDQWEIQSPSWPSTWDGYGLIEAKCSKCKEIPGHDCTCGIYTTLDHKYARQYANQPGSVLTLVEGLGHVELYTEGFRAEQGFVVAVVDDGTDPMADRLVADRIRCEIVPLRTAIQALSVQWYKFGMEWPKGLR